MEYPCRKPRVHVWHASSPSALILNIPAREGLPEPGRRARRRPGGERVAGGRHGGAAAGQGRGFRSQPVGKANPPPSKYQRPGRCPVQRRTWGDKPFSTSAAPIRDGSGPRYGAGRVDGQLHVPPKTLFSVGSRFAEKRDFQLARAASGGAPDFTSGGRYPGTLWVTGY